MSAKQPQRRVLVVIGGGAAGFFAALTAARQAPDARVMILEKSARVLAKVRISGGGRCNVTHACFDPATLAGFYPRGGKELRQVFSRFQPRDTVEWFATQGVRLKTEADGRMFPVTDDSATIVECLERVARDLHVEVHTGCSVSGIRTAPSGGFELALSDGTLRADRVLVATGGSPMEKGLHWLTSMGLDIVPPVPSLFTFNLPGDPITSLQGVVVEPAEVRLQGTRFRETGPVLITHWGLSGPAVLRLSARAARELVAVQYRQDVLVDWLPASSDEQVLDRFSHNRQAHGARQLRSYTFEGLPRRLWEFLLDQADVPHTATWSDLRSNQARRLLELLRRDRHRVDGKTTFKEEFVTCGGIHLKEVDFRTMESRQIPGLYFAGEVLDIDGLTGGFNFQAAWSTGFVAGSSMAADVPRAD
jgi:hypothetical protein